MSYGNTRCTYFFTHIYERKNLLTEEERQYIKNVITPFRNRVSGIRKLEDYSHSYVLQILYDRCYDSRHDVMHYEVIWLPSFPKTDKAFQNLNCNEVYTLEFLCL